MNIKPRMSKRKRHRRNRNNPHLYCQVCRVNRPMNGGPCPLCLSRRGESVVSATPGDSMSQAPQPETSDEGVGDEVMPVKQGITATASRSRKAAINRLRNTLAAGRYVEDEGAGYNDLLRDPRWLARRLFVFDLRGWRCERCLSGSKTLHLHHKKYTGRPWEAPESDLVVLCKGCHAKEHGIEPKRGRRKRENSGNEPCEKVGPRY